MPHAAWRVADGATVLAERSSERPFAAASMIKTFLLAAVLEAGLELDRRHAVAADLRCGGDGVLRDLAVPDGLPLRDLLRLMIVLSDNTATNVVLEALGGPATVNERFAARGLESTRIRSWVGGVRPGVGGEPAGLELPTPAGLGVTSVAEHAATVDRLLETSLARELLLAQQDRRSLARPLRDDVAFAHKTGTVGRARHDGGVLLGRVSVTVFTDGGAEAEWPDHPACLGMAEGMERTAQALGLDVLLR